MTDAAFEGRVIAELGAIRKEVSDVAKSTTRIEQQQIHLESRVRTLEKWKSGQHQALTETGQHEIARLQEELRKREEAALAEVQARRQQWKSALGKVALLVVGSFLAIVGPLVAKALGWG